jgi:hypothetical protein
MTMAVSKAVGHGAKAVICASTGNTSASAAAFAAAAGIQSVVLVPEGKIALGKLSQAVAHKAQILQVQGNFDDCLDLARNLADNYPVHLVNSVNPAIKSLNYLNNILARIEANNAGVEEAIMLNSDGFVAECTGDNIFLVQKGKLFTPPLSAGALYGITRNTVLDVAKEEGIAFSEPNLTRYDVYNADEMFLTGTAAEIIPVVKVDGRVIGTGKPGPVTAKLLAGFQARTRTDGEIIFA